MRAAADSSIILDILLDDPDHGESSMILLESYLRKGAVIICPVVFSECSAILIPTSGFIAISREMGLSFDGFTPEICTTAGRMWRDYRTCGGSRRRIMADFLIGAHALHRADILLTRDRGFYREYFQGLKIAS